MYGREAEFETIIVGLKVRDAIEITAAFPIGSRYLHARYRLFLRVPRPFHDLDHYRIK